MIGTLGFNVARLHPPSGLQGRCNLSIGEELLHEGQHFVTRDRTTTEESNTAEGTRAGYITLVGRPNAGKSTLLNHLVGEHLSIVTAKAQTTWQRVTGILSTGNDQMIFLDTPGLLEVRDLLQRTMLRAALEALAEADIIILVVDATTGPSSRETASTLTALKENAAPLHVALNKVDIADKEAIRAWENWVDTELVGSVYRLSSLTGEGVDTLLVGVRADLPVGPFLYPEQDIASDPVRFFVAELVRETIFELYQQEIPYSTFCQVEEFREGQDPVYIQVQIFVERQSQKGILIGKKGRAIRELGELARTKVEHFLDERVYLDLWVKPLKAWRKNRAYLSQLGFRLPEDDESSVP
ncbi:MAG TPA: GTPase Era [Gemmatimonadetes bacterium]|nr:GTPase Era [Gemmatimonadota bacterium]HIC16462.1 GTPase Era [Gemmatimonadota bacterium]HIN79074.1 GTPase Era [Gemmatimonadota bacterium]